MKDRIESPIQIGQFKLSRTAVEFILHTEPNVSPPEFTIICLTEGGPATTVSWQRPNGHILGQGDSDYETSQIIVDTYYSVYENRLRVRGREGGTYFCFISNNIKDYFPDLVNMTARGPGVSCKFMSIYTCIHYIIIIASMQLLMSPPVLVPLLSPIVHMSTLQ